MKGQTCVQWRNVFSDEKWPVIAEIELEGSSAMMKSVLKTSSDSRSTATLCSGKMFGRHNWHIYKKNISTSVSRSDHKKATMAKEINR
jgi:hypothetical protein